MVKKAPADNQNQLLASLPSYALHVLIGVYLVSAQWSPSDSTSVSSGDSIVLIIMGLGIGLLSTVTMILSGRNESRYHLTSLLVLLFVGWLATATFFAYGHANFRASLLGLWQTIALIGVLQGLTQAFRCEAIHNRVLQWTVGLSVGTTAYALYQYFVSMPKTRARFQVYKEEMLGDVGLTLGTPEAMQFENRLFSTEPIGPFALTNSLAGTLAPVVVLVGFVLVGLLWQDVSRLLFVLGSSSSTNRNENELRQRRWKWLSIGVLILGLSGFVLLLTKSRTAWLATLIGAMASGLVIYKIAGRLNPRIVSIGLASLASGAGLLILIVFWLDSAIIMEAGKSLLYRMEYWQGAWQLALRSPWFGYGPLAFQAEYTTVKAMTASENPADPHNMWMEILVWGGFPLLGVSIAMAIGLMLTQIKYLFRIPGGQIQLSVEHGSETSQKDSLVDQSPAKRDSQPMLLDAGAIIIQILILFFGLIVYSVNDQSDLLFNAIAFCVGASICYWSVRAVRLTQIGLWGSSVLILLVVSVHFLFSGGWMQPGAMSPFLVGLAGVLQMRPKNGEADVTAAPCKGSWVAYPLFAAWATVAILFGLLTLKPEQARGPLEQLQRENRLTELPVEDYFKALDASGWDPDPASWLMRGAYQRLTDKNLGQSSRWKWLEVYRQAKRKWIANDPRNWLVASQISMMDASVLVACRSAGFDPTGFLEMNDIVAEANRATKLNPTSAQGQLQKAVFLYWGREVDGTKAALDLAEKIDQTTPHADRKLSVCSVWVPDELAREGSQSLQASQAAGMPGFFKGEPVFSWLRKVTP